MENKPTFLMQITTVFLLLTNPASNIVKPAAIHITKKPPIQNNRVLKIKVISTGSAIATS